MRRRLALLSEPGEQNRLHSNAALGFTVRRELQEVSDTSMVGSRGLAVVANRANDNARSHDREGVPPFQAEPQPPKGN